MKLKFLASKGSLGILAIGASVVMLYQNCSKVGIADQAPESVASQSSGGGGNGINGQPTGSDPSCKAGDPNCGDGTPGLGTSSTPPTTCTTSITSTNIAGNVKVFFLLDVSGSNQYGDDRNGKIPTDPSQLDGNLNCKDGSQSSSTCKPWRLGVLNKFLNTYDTKANFSFQFASFQGNSASALITDSNNHTVFSSDVTGAINPAVVNFLKVQDSSSTPYQAVLNIAASAIQQDMKSSPGSKYVLIMLTDGMPTDDQFSTSSTSANEAALAAAVAQVANLSPGYITFNTILYYPSGHEFVDAKGNLQAMATAGKGLFVDAVSSNSNGTPAPPFQIDPYVTVATGSTGCP